MQTSLIDVEFPRFNGLTIGKVFNVTPEANMVDVLLFDGTRLKNVQLMVPYASSSAGISNLPLPKYDQSLDDKDFPLSSANQNEVDVFVVIAFLGGTITRPIALGFLFPEENQVLCGRDDNTGNKNGGMYLFKHTSNVHEIIDKDGQIQISHPSGLLIKIGTYDTGKTPAQQQITVNNWDKDIRAFKTGNPQSEDDTESAAPYVHVYHPSGSYITVDDEGDVTVYGVKDAAVTIKGNVTELVEGNVNRTIKGDVTETIEGTLSTTVKDDVSITYEKKLSETVKDDATVTYEQDLTEQIDGDLGKTVLGNETEGITGSLNKTVGGGEIDNITGAWDRNATGVISDQGSSITHN